MKIIRKYFISLISLLVFSTCLHARINIFEPWFPGQDSNVTKMYLYETRASLLIGERYTEIPVMFTYVFNTRAEIGGRWGIKYLDDKLGINDLIIGLKYVILNESAQKPAIIGEIGTSLPTADSSNNLGTGAVGFLLHWALEKKIEQIIGYFGLGITINSENNDNLKHGNVFYYHIGTKFPYTQYWDLFAEFKGFNHGKTEQNNIDLVNNYQEIYLAPGFNYKWSKTTTISSSLLIGLTPESHDLGLIISADF